MKNLLEAIAGATICLVAAYLLGRILMKAGLHELDNYLNNKFNKTKSNTDETKKE